MLKTICILAKSKLITGKQRKNISLKTKGKKNVALVNLKVLFEAKIELLQLTYKQD